MTPEESFESLRSQLRGKLVTDRQLAANSLSVWIATRENDDSGFTVWFDPAWHIATPAGVIAGSRQAQDEDDPAGWEAVSNAIDALIGLTVEDLRRDDVSGDLDLVLSSGYRVRSFVTDPRDHVLWTIRDLANGLRVYGAPGRLTVREPA